jgi:hypothetical protein
MVVMSHQEACPGSPKKGGKGFNVMLQALPMHGNGKIVLREHDGKDGDTDQPPAGDDGKSPSQNRDGSSDRNQSRQQRQR